MQLRKLIPTASWPLVASCSVNLTLVVALIVVWRAQQAPTLSPTPPPAAAEVTSVKPKAASMAIQPAPFHWRQLDAPDFPSYVRNLRAIGCPEATIHDIIQGELKEIYTTRRQEVERELAAAPPQSRAALEQRLQQLKAEEATMLTTSLSSGASSAGAVAATQSASSQASAMQGAGATAAANDAGKTSSNALTPAAFLVGNDPSKPSPTTALSATPTDPRLNPPTAAVISQMRQNFINSMQNAGADSSSPNYRQSWNAAQRASDDQFSTIFGGDFFIQSQIQAARAANLANGANAPTGSN